MGNIVGSIYWEKTSKDKYYINYLDKLQKKYNLEKDEHNMLHWEKNMNNYSVQISGLSILWYGEENIKTKIKAFLYEAIQLFHENNIKYKVKEGFLPM